MASTSLSKKLLKCLDKYLNEIPNHQLLQFSKLKSDKKSLVYQRSYNHLFYGLPGFAYLYKRAAEFAPTPESKNYLLEMF